MKVAPCPRLSIKPGAVFFEDKTGAMHDLLTDKLLTPGEAARRMNRSTEWVRRKVRDGELYPVLRGQKRTIEIFSCALIDYRARQVLANAA